jgi:hypothetical protein
LGEEILSPDAGRFFLVDSLMLLGALSLDLDEDLRLFGRVPFPEGPQVATLGRLLLIVKNGISDVVLGNLFSSIEVVFLPVITMGSTVGCRPPLEAPVFFPLFFSLFFARALVLFLLSLLSWFLFKITDVSTP